MYLLHCEDLYVVYDLVNQLEDTNYLLAQFLFHFIMFVKNIFIVNKFNEPVFVQKGCDSKMIQFLPINHQNE